MRLFHMEQAAAVLLLRLHLHPRPRPLLPRLLHQLRALLLELQVLLVPTSRCPVQQ